MDEVLAPELIRIHQLNLGRSKRQMNIGMVYGAGRVSLPPFAVDLLVSGHLVQLDRLPK